ncbi:hypothetical protein [Rhodococcus sp. NPDC060176]|uniref:hypothetical protein n=1 Tax=Rhodococcus sp. NPDC060176 TaxID=3347062 RepID=UPI00364E408A
MFSFYVEYVVEGKVVTVRFSSPNFPFIQAVSSPSTGILSAVTLAKSPEAPGQGFAVGAASFVLDHYTPEAETALHKRSGYNGFPKRTTIVHRSLVNRNVALTWISPGLLDAARSIMGRTVAEYAEAGIEIVGMEPSCARVLRSDSLKLLDSDIVDTTADSTRTFDELLATSGWTSPELIASRYLQNRIATITQ